MNTHWWKMLTVRCTPTMAARIAEAAKAAGMSQNMFMLNAITSAVNVTRAVVNTDIRTCPTCGWTTSVDHPVCGCAFENKLKHG